VLREHRAQIADIATTKIGTRTALERADAAERALLVFMQLGFVERMGWVLFGYTWLTDAQPPLDLDAVFGPRIPRHPPAARYR
jgi:hypothetical protein